MVDALVFGGSLPAYKGKAVRWGGPQGRSEGFGKVSGFPGDCSKVLCMFW